MEISECGQVLFFSETQSSTEMNWLVSRYIGSNHPFQCDDDAIHSIVSNSQWLYGLALSTFSILGASLLIIPFQKWICYRRTINGLVFLLSPFCASFRVRNEYVYFHFLGIFTVKTFQLISIQVSKQWT